MPCKHPPVAFVFKSLDSSLQFRRQRPVLTPMERYKLGKPKQHENVDMPVAVVHDAHRGRQEHVWPLLRRRMAEYPQRRSSATGLYQNIDSDMQTAEPTTIFVRTN